MTGVTFKGLHSYNNFKLNMLSDNRQVLPAAVRFIKQVPGYPGTVDFGNDTPNEKVIRIIFQLNYKMQPTILQTAAEQIGGWLYDDGNYYDLIFDDAPQRKYKAKVTSSVDLSQNVAVGTFGVEFTCNPPYPFALDNSTVSPADVAARLLWDNATNLSGLEYIKDLTADGAFKFTVGGTHNVLPKIYLIGNIPSGLQLAYGGTYWMYTAALQFDGILIDCAAQTVMRLSDGANLYPYVDSVKNTYFSLASGQNEIDITGTGGAWPNDVIIAVVFTPIP